MRTQCTGSWVGFFFSFILATGFFFSVLDFFPSKYKKLSQVRSAQTLSIALSYLEDFKAVNIKDTNVIFFMVLLHSLINRLIKQKENVKQSVVYIFKRYIHILKSSYKNIWLLQKEHI